MKQVQWFPGHMFKSLREIKEKLKLMDIIYILLDARLPYSSMNPEIKRIVGDKPTLLLFNKIDLADRKHMEPWIKHYEEEGFHSLLINANTGFNVNKIFSVSKTIIEDKIARLNAKGMKKESIRAMILGIPNVGKSTLINRLINKNVATTANKPGVTKTQQWIKINPQFELLDTPGVLWPKFEDEKVGFHLAITGAIKDDTLPLNEVIHYSLTFLKTFYPFRLKKRYDLPLDTDITNDEILGYIGRKRGAVIKGGEINFDRVYQIILTDIRSNQLGALTFDARES